MAACEITVIMVSDMKRFGLHLLIALLTFMLGVFVHFGLNVLPSSLWTKLDNTKCFYNSRPCDEHTVYRSLTGELFIILPEAHPVSGDDESAWKFPWHYLIRPKEGTSEVAFSGMLTRFGKYAYGSDNTQLSNRLSACAEDGCPPVIIGQNSVEFGSIYRKAHVRIEW
jgi:hypothetical protein